MNKSEIFSLAHHNTRLKVLKNALLRRKKIKYNIIFKYELKKVINSQPQKVTIYNGSKKVNKACAMVGDYKRPTIANDSLETPFFILSVFAILIIFALTLQAINYL